MLSIHRCVYPSWTARGIFGRVGLGLRSRDPLACYQRRQSTTVCYSVSTHLLTRYTTTTLPSTASLPRDICQTLSSALVWTANSVRSVFIASTKPALLQVRHGIQFDSFGGEAARYDARSLLYRFHPFADHSIREAHPPAPGRDYSCLRCFCCRPLP